MTKRLVLIDGMSVFYRGYFAMPGLSLPDGTPTGGVYGFASIAIEVIKKLNPDYVAVAWDKSKTATAKRKEIYPEYKAGRTRPPDDFFAQIPLLHELLDSFGWPLIEMDNYEADDIIGTISVEAAKKDIETCIVSGDYDMMQLLSPHTSVYINKKGADMLHFTAAEFEQKYGVSLTQFVDYKALVGDSSDNIPGVRGIGPKAAQSLLAEFGSLDNIYEHLDDLTPSQRTKLEDSRDNAFMSRELARIWCDVPIQLDWEEADIHNTNLANVADKLRELEFQSLVKRLPKHMQSMPEAGALYFELEHQADVREVAWPDELHIDGPVVISLKEDTLWISLDNKSVHKKQISEIDTSVWTLLAFATVISYDTKQLYHELAAKGVKVRFASLHDVRQAAFLIDPLRRDRSLTALVGDEIDSVESEISGLWQVYAWQREALTHIPSVENIAQEFDFPVIYSLFEMESRGIRIDKSQLARMSDELALEYTKLEQEIFEMVGYEFNIASPAQLSEVLFTKLQLTTTGIKRGKTGYSTDQKTLDKLRGVHPIIELIERTRELAKLKNTYVDTLPKLADEADRIHTTFHQDVAATGRLSSADPNLQNIPVRTELGRRIREAFIPSDGKVFVSADYSQFELRLAAVLAGDTKLIEDFNSDIDIHAKTASEVYGIPLEAVTKAQRRDAKVINFGVLYGMSPHGLAAATGMSFTQAKEFIDQYFTLRAPIREFIDKTLQQARTEGYVETFYGRRRPTPDIHSTNFIVRQSAERAAANMPIQGTEADLMKRAMIQLDSALEGKAEQLLQIHDSVLVECAPEDADSVGKTMKQVMETVAPELGINLRVDVTQGKHWGTL